MSIKWTPDLAVGVSLIDEQHKELFAKINGLIEACNRGKGKDEVAKTIEYLRSYVVFHFRDEQNLMQQNGFPEYDQHKALHDAFVEGLKQLSSELDEKGPGLSLVLKTNRIVVDWLVNHINRKDKIFGEFMRGKNS
ncbi:MAG: hemerythrin family protein [Firmicutes bacterium]|nr:hemerythrin family protein [Bacillota bacterium]